MDLQSSLILVPTEMERRRLLAIGGVAFQQLRIELCGFGPLAAGMATTQFLLEGQPSEGHPGEGHPGEGARADVLLCGIAGAYPNSQIVPGQVVRVSDVMLDGIGVFENGMLKSGNILGFQPTLPDQIVLLGAADLPGDSVLPIGFARNLRAVPLLTVCIASSDRQQALRREISYRASVEDMEGFAVAAACQRLNANLIILRGISNVAGDRDKSRWCIDTALRAVAEIFLEHLIKHHG